MSLQPYEAICHWGDQMLLLISQNDCLFHIAAGTEVDMAVSAEHEWNMVACSLAVYQLIFGPFRAFIMWLISDASLLSYAHMLLSDSFPLFLA